MLYSAAMQVPDWTLMLNADSEHVDVPLTPVRLPDQDWAVHLSYRHRHPDIGEGDGLVLFERQQQHHFPIAFGTVRRVRQAPTKSGPRLALELQELDRLEHSIPLEQLAASLTKVSNPFSPRRALRHRGWLNAQDAQRVVDGRLHPQRTIFFGLLRKLPFNWRRHLLLRAVELEWALRRRAGGEQAGTSPGGVPLRALLLSLQDEVVDPTGIAAAIAKKTPKQLRGHGGPTRLGAAGEPDWDAGALIKTSPVRFPGLSEGLDVLVRLEQELPDEEQGEPWPDLSARPTALQGLLR